MAYFGSNSIKDLLEKKGVIAPVKEGRIKYGAYELSLGNEVFQTDSKTGKKEILKEDKEQVVIKPGQMALLLTEEEIKIPENIIAFISIKASIKLKGLINVSGFHVDPGFAGKLLFSVYNAGPATIVLEKGSPYFPMWFAELNENNNYDGEHENQQHIPVKYIEALKAGELASPNALSERIDKLDSKKNYNEWLFKAIIALLVGISLKLFWDWSQYNNGFKDGFNQRTDQVKSDSIINVLLKEENTLLTEKRELIKDIDSLERVRKAKTKKTNQ